MILRSLLLCEDIRREIHGTHSIIGVFNSLKGYLGEKYSFKGFFGITNYLGMAKLKIIIKSPDGIEVKKFFSDDIPCTNRKDIFVGIITITDLFFKSYGSYVIYIYDMENTELGNIALNYSVPDYQTNNLVVNNEVIEVPRVNYHDNRELISFSKLFLRQYKPLTEPFKSVEFISQFMASDGIGSVSRFIVQELIKDKVKVKATPIYGDSDSKNWIKSLPEEMVCKDETDITIVNSLPPHIKNACEAKRLLMFTYWEASKVDKSWVNVVNTADAIFVPSNYVKEIYVNSGAKEEKLIVYNQPISGEFKYAEKGDTKLYEEDYNYFDILFLGTAIPRKGIDVFIVAVEKVFGNDIKVRIRIHTKPWSEALGDTRREIQKYCKGKEEKYFITTDILPTSAIVRLIQGVDLVVTPSRSEGLGLIPLQSIICGTPTIVPNHTGFKEYCEYPGFVKLEKFKSVKGEGIYASGFWFEPDINELSEKLLYCKENIKELNKEAKKSSVVLSKKYSAEETYKTLKQQINVVYKV